MSYLYGIIAEISDIELGYPALIKIITPCCTSEPLKVITSRFTDDNTLINKLILLCSSKTPCEIHYRFDVVEDVYPIEGCNEYSYAPSFCLPVDGFLSYIPVVNMYGIRYATDSETIIDFYDQATDSEIEGTKFYVPYSDVITVLRQSGFGRLFVESKTKAGNPALFQPSDSFRPYKKSGWVPYSKRSPADCTKEYYFYLMDNRLGEIRTVRSRLDVVASSYKVIAWYECVNDEVPNISDSLEQLLHPKFIRY